MYSGVKELETRFLEELHRYVRTTGEAPTLGGHVEMREAFGAYTTRIKENTRGSRRKRLNSEVV